MSVRFLEGLLVGPLICYVKPRLPTIPVGQRQPRDMAIVLGQLLTIPHFSERGGAFSTHLPILVRGAL